MADPACTLQRGGVSMQLRHDGQTIEQPTEADIRAAVPDRAPGANWSLMLVRGDDDMLEVEGDDRGTYALTHIDGERWHETMAPLHADQVRDILLLYRAGDARWRERATWSTWDPKSLGKAAARDPSLGPPRWLILVYALVIGGFCLQIVSLLFDISLPLPDLPTPRATFSWPTIALPLALDSTAARMILIFFGLCVVLFAVLAVAKAVEVRRTQRWASVFGKITASSIGTERVTDLAVGLPRRRRVPKITFEYEVKGKAYRGARISLAERIPDAEVSDIIARHPVGRTVEVFYDPAKPARAVLNRTPPTGIARGCLGLFAVGLIVVVALMWAVTNGPAVVQTVLPRSMPWIMVPMALVSALFFTIFAVVAKRAFDAQRWPQVVGRIISNDIEVSRGDSRHRHAPRVRYSYTVAGRAYEGDGIYLDAEVYGSRSYAEKIVARYPVGSLVTIRHDPTDPSTAALDLSLGLTWVLPIIGALCLGIAVWASGLFW